MEEEDPLAFYFNLCRPSSSVQGIFGPPQSDPITDGDTATSSPAVPAAAMASSSSAVPAGVTPMEEEHFHTPPQDSLHPSSEEQQVDDSGGPDNLGFAAGTTSTHMNDDDDDGDDDIAEISELEFEKFASARTKSDGPRSERLKDSGKNVCSDLEMEKEKDHGVVGPSEGNVFVEMPDRETDDESEEGLSTFELIEMYQKLSSEISGGVNVKGKRALPASITRDWETTTSCVNREKGSDNLSEKERLLRDLVSTSKKAMEKDKAYEHLDWDAVVGALTMEDEMVGDGSMAMGIVDFLENAKKNGMVFPRPRWWPPEGIIDR